MRRTRRYFSTIEKSTSKESDGDAESSHDLEESNQGKKMSAHDEDILISIIMKFFTVIEDNSTIKLTPRKRSYPSSGTKCEFCHETYWNIWCSFGAIWYQ